MPGLCATTNNRSNYIAVLRRSPLDNRKPLHGPEGILPIHLDTCIILKLVNAILRQRCEVFHCDYMLGEKHAIHSIPELKPRAIDCVFVSKNRDFLALKEQNIIGVRGMPLYQGVQVPYVPGRGKH